MKKSRSKPIAEVPPWEIDQEAIKKRDLEYRANETLNQLRSDRHELLRLIEWREEQIDMLDEAYMGLKKKLRELLAKEQLT